MAQARGVNLLGAVTWAFEFEDQPWFRGFRDLATNGVDKPVLNVFRMFGMMEDTRVEVNNDRAYDAFKIRDASVRGEADINALASKSSRSATVMVWNYLDDNKPGAISPVTITLQGLPARSVTLTHYRIDQGHSNSYEVWKKMGSPQQPTAAQIAELEKAGQLQLLDAPRKYTVKNRTLSLPMNLPGQGVSLLKVNW